MREAASRGFWMSSEAPLGYNRVMVQDGPKKRPKLEPDPDSSHVVRRMFDIGGAKSFGMKAIWKRDDYWEVPKVVDGVIQELEELPEVISKLT